MKKRLLVGPAFALAAGLVPGLPPPVPAKTSPSDERIMLFVVIPLLVVGIVSSVWLIIKAMWNLWRGS